MPPGGADHVFFRILVRDEIPSFRIVEGPHDHRLVGIASHEGHQDLGVLVEGEMDAVVGPRKGGGQPDPPRSFLGLPFGERKGKADLVFPVLVQFRERPRSFRLDDRLDDARDPGPGGPAFGTEGNLRQKGIEICDEPRLSRGGIHSCERSLHAPLETGPDDEKRCVHLLPEMALDLNGRARPDLHCGARSGIGLCPTPKDLGEDLGLTLRVGIGPEIAPVFLEQGFRARVENRLLADFKVRLPIVEVLDHHISGYRTGRFVELDQGVVLKSDVELSRRAVGQGLCPGGLSFWGV